MERIYRKEKSRSFLNDSRLIKEWYHFLLILKILQNPGSDNHGSAEFHVFNNLLDLLLCPLLCFVEFVSRFQAGIYAEIELDLRFRA
jgi:hypothetical protein